MSGHNVLFDMDNGRIGIVESDCNYNDILTAEGKQHEMTTVDPYASFNDIMRWYEEDQCKNEKMRCIFRLVTVVLNYVCFGLLLYLIIRHRQFHRTSSNEESEGDGRMLSKKPFIEKEGATSLNVVPTAFTNDLGKLL